MSVPFLLFGCVSQLRVMPVAVARPVNCHRDVVLLIRDKGHDDIRRPFLLLNEKIDNQNSPKNK